MAEAIIAAAQATAQRTRAVNRVLVVGMILLGSTDDHFKMRGASNAVSNLGLRRRTN